MNSLDFFEEILRNRAYCVPEEFENYFHSNYAEIEVFRVFIKSGNILGDDIFSIYPYYLID